MVLLRDQDRSLWDLDQIAAGRAELDRAVAIAEAGKVEAALALVERLKLDRYHYLHATRAELLRRLDRVEDARAAYQHALELVHSDAERRFLARRLAQLQG